MIDRSTKKQRESREMERLYMKLKTCKKVAAAMNAHRVRGDKQITPATVNYRLNHMGVKMQPVGRPTTREMISRRSGE